MVECNGTYNLMTAALEDLTLKAARQRVVAVCSLGAYKHGGYGKKLVEQFSCNVQCKFWPRTGNN